MFCGEVEALGNVMTAARIGAWVTAGGLTWLDITVDTEVCPVAPAAVTAADTTLAPTTSGVADLTAAELTRTFGVGGMEADVTLDVTGVAGLEIMPVEETSASAGCFCIASDEGVFLSSVSTDSLAELCDALPASCACWC